MADGSVQAAQTVAQGLASWLSEQIAEDERVAKAEQHIVKIWIAPTPFEERFSPARVLAECEAKRAIIALHRTRRDTQPDAYATYEESLDQCATCGPGDEWEAQEHADNHRYPCPTLRHLALVFADRPGYQQEWRP